MDLVPVLVWAVQFLLGGVAAWLWFSITRLQARLEATQGELNAHKVEVAKDYITKTEVTDMKKEIVDHLVRIESKIDGRK